MKPKTPTRPSVKAVPPGPTVENGRYLANSVGNCVNCHTKLDMRTGAFAGPLARPIPILRFGRDVGRGGPTGRRNSKPPSGDLLPRLQGRPLLGRAVAVGAVGRAAEPGNDHARSWPDRGLAWMSGYGASSLRLARTSGR